MGLTDTLARSKKERADRAAMNRKVLIARGTAKTKHLSLSATLDLAAVLLGMNKKLWGDPGLADMHNPRAQLDFNTCDALMALPLTGRARTFVEHLAHRLSSENRPACVSLADMMPLDPFATVR